MIRLATASDTPAIERFLADHVDSSMFPRASLRAGGPADPREGPWAIALDGDRVTGVVSHASSGMVLVQCPGAELEILVREMNAARSERRVTGIAGPLDQVERAREALGLTASSRTSAEDLFALALDRLAEPPLPLDARCRRTEPRDLEICSAWRVEYLIETFAFPRGEALTSRARADVESVHARGDAFVLEIGGELLAYSALNARLPDIVQVGGVWTPPEHRSRGHARAVVAGSLAIARGDGVGRAVLFTARENTPAQRAYRALGFEKVGAYGLTLVTS